MIKNNQFFFKFKIYCFFGYVSNFDEILLINNQIGLKSLIVTDPDQFKISM